MKVESSIELMLLGSPKVCVSGNPVTGFRSRKAQALLFYLAVSRRTHSRPQLAGLLWGDWPDSDARTSLNMVLSNLRQLVGEHLTITRQHVTFSSTAYYLDVERLENAAVATPGAGIGIIDQAAAVYRGDFLEGFSIADAPEYDNWLQLQHTRLRHHALTVLSKLVDYHTQAASWVQAICYCRRALELEPWDEALQRTLILLLSRNGERNAAIAQYERCRQLLADELGIDPEPATDALLEQIRNNRVAGGNTKKTSMPAVVTEPAIKPIRNLPSVSTAFIGRKHEMGLMIQRLQNPYCRLLTITGPGGVGKTRLALQMVHHLEEQNLLADWFPGGVVFVSLAPVATLTGLISAVAKAIDCPDSGDKPLQQQLFHHLSTRKLLLILDNFENLLGHVEWLSELLSDAPTAKLVATSRVSLNLQEEWILTMAGMRFPDAGPGLRTEPDSRKHGTEQYDALELFEQSALRVWPGFSLQKEYSDVTRICRLVDGMPLAIELAAAWLRSLNIAQIGGEIERNIDILTARHRNGESRHHSIRGVLEQSWRLLDAAERQILQQLAVFQGGFQLEAAAAVVEASPAQLAGLVDKSLLYYAGESNRYQIHELLRQFTAEKLAAEDNGMDAATRSAHSVYFLEFLTRQGRLLNSSAQRQALNAISGEYDNIAAAWYWALRTGDSSVLAPLAEVLFNFYQIRSRCEQGEELFATTLKFLQQQIDESGDGHNALITKISQRRMALRTYIGDHQSAMENFRRTLPELEKIGDKREMAFAHTMLGQLAAWDGDPLRAEQHLYAGVMLSRKNGDLAASAHTLERLAQMEIHLGRLTEGRRQADESLIICRRLGRPDWIAGALDTLGFATFCLGEYDISESCYRESLAIFEIIGDNAGISLALGGLGYVSAARSKADQALTLLDQAVVQARGTGHRLYLCTRLICLAFAAAELGYYECTGTAAEEGRSIASELNSRYLLCHTYVLLSSAARGMGELQKSRSLCRLALQEIKQQKLPAIVHMMPSIQLAELLICEAKQPDIGKASKRVKLCQARKLLDIIIQHPSCWQINKARAQRLMVELETKPLYETDAGIQKLSNKTGDLLQLIEACLNADVTLQAEIVHANLN